MKRLLAMAAPALLSLIALTGTASASAATHPAAANAPAVAAQPAVPAPVFPPPPGCTPGNLCFYAAAGWRDGPGQLAGPNPSWFVFPHSSCPTGTWADCASS